MLRRGLIMPEDTIAQNGQVHVIGPARSQLKLKPQELSEQDSIAISKFLLDLTKRPF